MSDLDVQDVRDIIEAEQEIQKREQDLATKIRGLTDNPAITDADAEILESIRKVKEEREIRLGIRPGKISLFFCLKRLRLFVEPSR
jgi:plasmid stabilization system protein ParE